MKSILIKIGFILLFIIAAFFVFRFIVPRTESIKIETQSNNNEEIAQQLFSKFLTSYKGINIPKKQRLKDFSINGINIIKENQNAFTFTVKYSLRTYVKESEWLVGSGEAAEKNWIKDKFSYVEVEKKDDNYMIVRYGTGQ